MNGTHIQAQALRVRVRVWSRFFFFRVTNMTGTSQIKNSSLEEVTLSSWRVILLKQRL